MDKMVNVDFWKNKRVFVTGHTGFKGSWLVQILKNFGAEVCGYSLEPNTNPNLFEIAKIEDGINHNIGDVRDFEKMFKVFDDFKPEIVFHLAAQPIVLASYKEPKYTYETNVLGTVNILECVRLTDCVKSFVNITTDKVYKNNDEAVSFDETMPLDGYDPYSNSKSCSELVTHSYRSSFFGEREVSISTVRAGNVIGGGDFADNRIIPDSVRAYLSNSTLKLRNPHSIRPYQHVLDALFAYLIVAEKQYDNKTFQGEYNVGPDDSDCIETGELVDLFCSNLSENMKYEYMQINGPHEANFLKLNNGKIKKVFGWNPRWNVSDAIKQTVKWVEAYKNNKDMVLELNNEIKEFLEG